jgi:hypothetical protein
METLSKDKLLSGLTNLISTRATATVNQVILEYEKTHPSANIDSELREEVLEQAISNLTFQSGKIRIKAIENQDVLTERFNNWFEDEAKPSLIHTINVILEPKDAKK